MSEGLSSLPEIVTVPDLDHVVIGAAVDFSGFMVHRQPPDPVLVRTDGDLTDPLSHAVAEIPGTNRAVGASAEEPRVSEPLEGIYRSRVAREPP